MLSGGGYGKPPSTPDPSAKPRPSSGGSAVPKRKVRTPLTDPSPPNSSRGGSGSTAAATGAAVMSSRPTQSPNPQPHKKSHYAPTAAPTAAGGDMSLLSVAGSGAALSVRRKSDASLIGVSPDFGKVQTFAIADGKLSFAAPAAAPAATAAAASASSGGASARRASASAMPPPQQPATSVKRSSPVKAPSAAAAAAAGTPKRTSSRPASAAPTTTVSSTPSRTVPHTPKKSSGVSSAVTSTPRATPSAAPPSAPRKNPTPTTATRPTATAAPTSGLISIDAHRNVAHAIMNAGPGGDPHADPSLGGADPSGTGFNASSDSITAMLDGLAIAADDNTPPAGSARSTAGKNGKPRSAGASKSSASAAAAAAATAASPYYPRSAGAEQPAMRDSRSPSPNLLPAATGTGTGTNKTAGAIRAASAGVGRSVNPNKPVAALPVGSLVSSTSSSSLHSVSDVTRSTAPAQSAPVVVPDSTPRRSVVRLARPPSATATPMPLASPSSSIASTSSASSTSSSPTPPTPVHVTSFARPAPLFGSPPNDAAAAAAVAEPATVKAGRRGSGTAKYKLPPPAYPAVAPSPEQPQQPSPPQLQPQTKPPLPALMSSAEPVRRANSSVSPEPYVPAPKRNLMLEIGAAAGGGLTKPESGSSMPVTANDDGDDGMHNDDPIVSAASGFGGLNDPLNNTLNGTLNGSVARSLPPQMMGADSPRTTKAAGSGLNGRFPMALPGAGGGGGGGGMSGFGSAHASTEATIAILASTEGGIQTTPNGDGDGAELTMKDVERSIELANQIIKRPGRVLASSFDGRASYEVSKTGTLRAGGFEIKHGVMSTPDRPKRVDADGVPTSESLLDRDHKSSPPPATPDPNGALSPISLTNFIDPQSPSVPTQLALGYAVQSSDVTQLGELGRGQNGTVYKCLYLTEQLCSFVALKSVNVHDKPQRHQFIKELNAFATCASDSIVGFMGAYFEHTHACMALEYMNRGSLEHCVQSYGRLSEPVIAHIAKHMLFGLQHLHSHFLVHRDIKPANVLVSSNGSVKISDFGLLKQLQNANTLCTTFNGTLSFLSPERVNSTGFSYPSDIWALGISLIYCATQKIPTSTDYWTLLAALKHPSSLPSLPRDEMYSAEFRDFVDQCLKMEASERGTAFSLAAHPFITKNALSKATLPLSTAQWPFAAPLPPDLKELEVISDAVIRKCYPAGTWNGSLADQSRLARIAAQLGTDTEVVIQCFARKLKLVKSSTPRGSSTPAAPNSAAAIAATAAPANSNTAAATSSAAAVAAVSRPTTASKSSAAASATASAAAAAATASARNRTKPTVKSKK